MSKRPLPMSAIFDPKRHIFTQRDDITQADELEALRARCERLRRLCAVDYGGPGPLTTKYREALIHEGMLCPGDLDDDLVTR